MFNLRPPTPLKDNYSRNHLLSACFLLDGVEYEEESHEGEFPRSLFLSLDSAVDSGVEFIRLISLLRSSSSSSRLRFASGSLVTTVWRKKIAINHLFSQIGPFWVIWSKFFFRFLDHSKISKTEPHLEKNISWTRFFPNLKFSGMLRNIKIYHFWQFEQNRWRSFTLPKFKVPKNTHIRHYWMIQIFPGKTAWHVSCPYSKELSCKKSRKSLEPFLRKTGNQPTDPDNKVNGGDSMGPAPTKSQVKMNMWVSRKMQDNARHCRTLLEM